MKKIFLLFICCSICKLYATGYKMNTEEVLKKKTSSVFFIKSDSLIKLKFNEISKLKKKEEFAAALQDALKLLDECKKLENYYWSYKCLNLIADIYNKTNKFSESLKYYKESLTQIDLIALEKKDTKLIDLDFVKTLLRVGSTYHKLSVSIQENNKFHYLDSAKTYYEKIVKLPVLDNRIEKLKATAFANLSGIYEQDSIFDKAELYVNKAIKVFRRTDNNLKIANSLNNLGNIFLSQQKYTEAKEIYLEAIELIKNEKNPNAIRSKAGLYFNLAWAMRNLKDYKAYDFQEKYYDFQDTIREKEFVGIIDEITHKHNFENQKELFQKEAENKRLKDQRTFGLAGIIALLIILLLAFVINLNKLKQKNLNLELKQSKLIQSKKLNKLKSESQVRILNATIDGKESERKQIAETLHDSVSALLSSANMHLQATRKQFNGSTPTEIDKTQEIIQEASHKIRDLSHNLVSSILLKFGLDFAIRDIAEKYSNSELKIATEINNIGRYQQNFEIKVYNIIQEFINNILKHSKANNALIELKEENKKLFLTISDDGLGFDKTKINMKDGLGLNQIDARIQVMKGDFFIDSSLNNGTKISVELPILEKEAANHV